MNWHAMQAAESIENLPDPQRPGKLLQRKERRPVADVSVKQMSMGSWHASLSHGGAAINKLGSQNNAGQATTQGKKK